MAFRGTVKVPTADDETGAGTGQFDYFADMVLSKEISRRVELTGFGGVAFRGDPSPFSLSDGLRWGGGAAFGARANLRLTAEVCGEYPFDNEVLGEQGVLTGSDDRATSRTSSVLDVVDLGRFFDGQPSRNLRSTAPCVHRSSMARSSSTTRILWSAVLPGAMIGIR